MRIVTGRTYLLTRDEMAEAFSRWQLDHRLNAEEFRSEEDSAAMSVVELGYEMAANFITYLGEPV